MSKTILELQHDLDVARQNICPRAIIGHAFSTEQGDRKVRGRHTTLWIPLSINPRSASVRMLTSWVDEVYGRVLATLVKRNTFLYNGKSYREVVLFHDIKDARREKKR